MKLFTLAVLALIFSQNSFAAEARVELAPLQPSAQSQTIASPVAEKTQPQVTNKHEILNTYFLDRRPYQKLR